MGPHAARMVPTCSNSLTVFLHTYAMDPSDSSPFVPWSSRVPFTVNDDWTTDRPGQWKHRSVGPYCLRVVQKRAERPGSYPASSMSPSITSLRNRAIAVTITLILDNDVNYVNATPAPTTVVGNTLTWELPAFGLFGSAQLSVETLVPVGTAVGTPVVHALSVSNTLAESNYTNNAVNAGTVVTASLDPNDRIARTSSGLSVYAVFHRSGPSHRFTPHPLPRTPGNDTPSTVFATDAR